MNYLTVETIDDHVRIHYNNRYYHCKIKKVTSFKIIVYIMKLMILSKLKRS